MADPEMSTQDFDNDACLLEEKGVKPERTCAVSRKLLPLDRLIRFVVAPDGEVVVDLRRKLGGRGLWIEARRECVLAGQKQKVFARGFKRQVSVGEDLAFHIEGLMHKRLVQALSMTKKTGQALSGWGKVEALVKSGGCAGLIQAQDGAENGKQKIEGLARGGKLPLILALNINELSVALGGDNVVHAALKKGDQAGNWLKMAESLAFYQGNVGSPLHPTEGTVEE